MSRAPRPALAPALAALLAAAAGALWACGGSDAPASQPAALRVSIPPPTVVAATCADPSARLVVNGSVASCPVVTHRASPTGPISGVDVVCPEGVGLASATPYELVVVYVQGDAVVARAPVAPPPTLLAPGLNTLVVDPSAVGTALDANANGVWDIVDACP